MYISIIFVILFNVFGVNFNVYLKLFSLLFEKVYLNFNISYLDKCISYLKLVFLTLNTFECNLKYFFIWITVTSWRRIKYFQAYFFLYIQAFEILLALELLNGLYLKQFVV